MHAGSQCQCSAPSAWTWPGRSKDPEAKFGIDAAALTVDSDHGPDTDFGLVMPPRWCAAALHRPSRPWRPAYRRALHPGPSYSSRGRQETPGMWLRFVIRKGRGHICGCQGKERAQLVPSCPRPSQVVFSRQALYISWFYSNFGFPGCPRSPPPSATTVISARRDARFPRSPTGARRQMLARIRPAIGQASKVGTRMTPSYNMMHALSRSPESLTQEQLYL